MKVLNDLARTVGREITRVKKSRPYRPILFASLAIVAGFIVGVKTLNSEVFAQSNDKSISLGPRSLVTPQVEIKEPRVGERTQKFDENFEDDSDWLRRTSFQIENVSGKRVVHLRINVWFPETSSSGPIMVYPLTFGKRPWSKLPQHADDFLFAPEETLNVSLGSKHADIARFLAERHSVGSINQIRLEVSFIAFEAGTAWSLGTFMVPDPNKPGQYLPADRKHP